MITEACEYTNSFLSFAPTVGIILNVAADHLDFFKDLDDIRHSFRRYAELLPANGALIINGDIDNLEYFTKDLDCKVITVGSEESGSMYTAKILHLMNLLMEAMICMLKENLSTELL